jgi:hypothetical protein
MEAIRLRLNAQGASAAALRRAAVDPHDRLRLSGRLRRVLAEHPDVRHFTVDQIVRSLGSDTAASAALFAAAGVFEAPDAGFLSGRVTAVLGVKLAFGSRPVNLPRAVMRRKIPRNSLALLIHSLCGALDGVDFGLRERWTWVFHPLMNGVLGLLLFLLGLASMAPIVGGGVQHAASAFLVALGMAERDGLAAMVGAAAGLASIALAVLNVLSGRSLWKRIKVWLMHWARNLRLRALARMLDYCCEGLGELMRLRWSGLLLLVFAPAPLAEHAGRVNDAPLSALRLRARRSRMQASRAFPRPTAATHGS